METSSAAIYLATGSWRIIVKNNRVPRNGAQPGRHAVIAAAPAGLGRKAPAQTPDPTVPVLGSPEGCADG